MGQEKDLENCNVSIFSLMAQTLQNLDGKQADLPGTITVLSLFTLMSILDLAQEQVVTGTGAGEGCFGDAYRYLSQGQNPALRC